MVMDRKILWMILLKMLVCPDIASSTEFDYTGINFCNEHAQCGPIENIACRCVVDPNTEEITANLEQFRQGILDAHNVIRAEAAGGKIVKDKKAADMNMLAYNLVLEHMARCSVLKPPINSLGERFKDECTQHPDDDGKSYQQITFKSPFVTLTSDPKVWDEKLRDYLTEVSHFSGNTIKEYDGDIVNGMTIGNASTLMWSTLSLLGCARSHYITHGTTQYAYYMVCNYYSGVHPGLVKNESVYNIGEPCSKCGDGAECYGRNEGNPNEKYALMLCGQIEPITNAQLKPLTAAVIGGRGAGGNRNAQGTQESRDTEDLYPFEDYTDMTVAFRVLPNRSGPTSQLSFTLIVIVTVIKWMF